MRPSQILLVAAGGIALLPACTDECERLPPSFQLDIRSETGVASIEVTLGLPDERRSRTFNLPNGELDDGETSLAVNLERELTNDFEVDVAVTAYSAEDGEGGVIAAGQDRFTARPNACNLFDLELQVGTPPLPDAGSLDSGPLPDECMQGCDDSTCDTSCDGDCDTCNLTCAGSSTCEARCAGDQCNVECTGIARCDTRCSNGTNCDIDCGGSVQCKARCNGGAQCLLRCAGSIDCSYTLCGGGDTTCADGSIACNRACP